MNPSFLTTLEKAAQNKTPLLAILLDPDKITLYEVPQICHRISTHFVNYIFIGGSTVEDGKTDAVVNAIKKLLTIPIILFPGNINQITNKADGILFLSLVSGNNPDFLINQHVLAVPVLEKTSLEIIPTAYILIDGGTVTSTMKVSKTQPLNPENLTLITHTALAAKWLGMKIIYLEAGSGAYNSINPETITLIKNKTQLPIIVGGGIQNKETIQKMYNAGATLVVVGNAFEKNIIFT